METQMIVASGAALVAVINGVFLLVSQRNQHKTNSDLSGQVGIIKNEVKNSHSTNLRDDMDKQYTLLLRVAERVDKTSDDVREVRRATGRLFELDREKGLEIVALQNRVKRIQPCASHSAPPPPYPRRDYDD